VSPAKRRKPSNFQRASDGSMPLIEHIRELRSRVLKASVAILLGAGVMYYFSSRVVQFVLRPYCDYAEKLNTNNTCGLNLTSVLDPFMLQLKIAVYLGLAVSAPFWLYQLWAFIAPGLHRRERRYTYAFVAIATPLFSLGMGLGYVMVTRSIRFLLTLAPNISSVSLSLNMVEYFDFVTLVMVVFGLGFEFPLLILVLNVAGVVSARRLLSWWRVAIFLMFLFAGIVTPNPDPFSMTIFGLCLSALYFMAVGAAFVVDGRRARRAARESIGDDAVSPIEPVSPVDASTWGVHGSSDGGDEP
jgi:sec-independent protein translocase protein TatC